MKIVDAFWEKRNLNVDVIEISCSENDTAIELEGALKEVTVPYSVIKIPSGRVDLLMMATQYGYTNVETSIRFEGNVKNINLPDIYKRFENTVSVIEADSKLQKRVLQEIRSGLVFGTDRIALDPFFSIQIAGERYYNWTKDELNKGSKLAIAYYKDRPAAFGINKTSDGNTYYAILGGTLSEEANRGLGFLALYANMCSIKEQGGKKIVTQVSSNNLPIIKLHIEYGYDLKAMNYIMVKHQ